MFYKLLVTFHMIDRRNFVRMILITFLILTFLIGNSQELKKEMIIGSWALSSTRIIDPTICHPIQQLTDNFLSKFLFSKSGVFIYYSQDLKGGDNNKTSAGFWGLIAENKIILAIENEELILRASSRNGKLYLSNKIAELEFIRK